MCECQSERLDLLTLMRTRPPCAVHFHHAFPDESAARALNAGQLFPGQAFAAPA